MSRELVVGLKVNDTYVSVYVKQRLQFRGQDFWLYANNDFGPMQDDDSELLRRVCDLLRLNDSGIDRVQVHPYMLMFFKTPILTAEVMQSLISTAVLRAGFKPVFSDTVYEVPRLRDKEELYNDNKERFNSRPRLQHKLGEAAGRLVEYSN